MKHDLRTQDGVKAHMSAATSASDWDKRCEEVLAVNSGYPSFWFMAIMISGLAAQTAAKWGGDAEIHMTEF